ncbi:MAG: hypothetical protein C6W56_05235, partial [Caldibacillus debilis]
MITPEDPCPGEKPGNLLIPACRIRGSAPYENPSRTSFKIALAVGRRLSCLEKIAKRGEANVLLDKTEIRPTGLSGKNGRGRTVKLHALRILPPRMPHLY